MSKTNSAQYQKVLALLHAPKAPKSQLPPDSAVQMDLELGQPKSLPPPQNPELDFSPSAPKSTLFILRLERLLPSLESFLSSKEPDKLVSLLLQHCDVEEKEEPDKVDGFTKTEGTHQEGQGRGREETNRVLDTLCAIISAKDYALVLLNSEIKDFPREVTDFFLYVKSLSVPSVFLTTCVLDPAPQFPSYSFLGFGKKAGLKYLHALLTDDVESLEAEETPEFMARAIRFHTSGRSNVSYESLLFISENLKKNREMYTSNQSLIDFCRQAVAEAVPGVDPEKFFKHLCRWAWAKIMEHENTTEEAAKIFFAEKFPDLPDMDFLKKCPIFQLSPDGQWLFRHPFHDILAAFFAVSVFQKTFSENFDAELPKHQKLRTLEREIFRKQYFMKYVIHLFAELAPPHAPKFFGLLLDYDTDRKFYSCLIRNEVHLWDETFSEKLRGYFVITRSLIHFYRRTRSGHSLSYAKFRYWKKILRAASPEIVMERLTKWGEKVPQRLLPMPEALFDLAIKNKLYMEWRRKYFTNGTGGITHDIFFTIFSMLDGDSLERASRVSRLWCEIASSILLQRWTDAAKRMTDLLGRLLRLHGFKMTFLKSKNFQSDFFVNLALSKEKSCIQALKKVWTPKSNVGIEKIISMLQPPLQNFQTLPKQADIALRFCLKHGICSPEYPELYSDILNFILHKMPCNNSVLTKLLRLPHPEILSMALRHLQKNPVLLDYSLVDAIQRTHPEFPKAVVWECAHRGFLIHVMNRTLPGQKFKEIDFSDPGIFDRILPSNNHVPWVELARWYLNFSITRKIVTIESPTTFRSFCEILRRSVAYIPIGVDQFQILLELPIPDLYDLGLRNLFLQWGDHSITDFIKMLRRHFPENFEEILVTALSRIPKSLDHIANSALLRFALTEKIFFTPEIFPLLLNYLAIFFVSEEDLATEYLSLGFPEIKKCALKFLSTNPHPPKSIVMSMVQHGLSAEELWNATVENDKTSTYEKKEILVGLYDLGGIPQEKAQTVYLVGNSSLQSIHEMWTERKQDQP
jgi:hypothetical protein